MTDRFAAARHAAGAEHGIVHRDNRAFCGWPFVSGFWITARGDYVLGFKRLDADYTSADAINHDKVALAGPRLMTIRSSDKGRTWDAGSLRLLFDLGADQDAMFAGARGDYGSEPPIDFADPDVLVASGGTPDVYRPNSRAWVRVSTDGGQSWRPPILVPRVGLLFLTVTSDEGWKRRPAVFGWVPGAASWAFLSYVTPKDDDGAADNDRSLPLRFSGHRYFYPRAIVLPGGRILCSVRCQRDPTSVFWTEVFASDDGGRTWGFLSRVNDWGAPGDVLRMADGRIACVYGYRLPPFGIRARISADEGRTWGGEIILRDDGGSWDLGYPRVVEPEPGKLLAMYYMNTKDDPIQANGGVRHIAWTQFKPD